MALRVAHVDAPEIGRGSAASPDRFPFWQLVPIAAVFSAMAVHHVGDQLITSDVVTMLACAAILVFGLPHGSLDVALLRRSARLASARTMAVVCLYLGCAAAMFAVWSYAPLAALAIFFGLSCLHFSEDWAEVVPPFFAVGLATAMLSAPALLHGDVLAGVFRSLTGSRDARVLADIGMLMAPVALTSAGIGVWLIAQAGQPVRACQTAILLFGMIVLPPVLGFALFFCLAHSPVQFAKAKAELQIEGRGATNREIVALTMGALAIAVVMFALAERGSFVENSIRASFVTLSILTAPHMAVPLCVSVWDRRRGAIA